VDGVNSSYHCNIIIELTTATKMEFSDNIAELSELVFPEDMANLSRSVGMAMESLLDEFRGGIQLASMMYRYLASKPIQSAQIRRSVMQQLLALIRTSSDRQLDIVARILFDLLHIMFRRRSNAVMVRMIPKYRRVPSRIVLPSLLIYENIIIRGISIDGLLYKSWTLMIVHVYAKGLIVRTTGRLAFPSYSLREGDGTLRSSYNVYHCIEELDACRLDGNKFDPIRPRLVHCYTEHVPNGPAIEAWSWSEACRIVDAIIVSCPALDRIATRIQRAVRIFLFRRRRARKCIHKFVHRWLNGGLLRDGTIGIRARKDMEEFDADMKSFKRRRMDGVN
jgi:hypothetical protein